jgi:hypothetical protein
MSADIVKMLDEKAHESLAFAPALVPGHLMSIAARRIEQLEHELAMTLGALADIAYSEDMTLSVAKRKAKRVYDAARKP